MKTTTATLVILVSTNTCVIDSIESAEVHQLSVPTLERCEEISHNLDRLPQIRAYCESSEKE